MKLLKRLFGKKSIRPPHISITEKINIKQSRKLLEFCLLCGCDRFSVNFLHTAEDIEKSELFYNKLSPFYAGTSKLEKTVVYASCANKQVDYWKFNVDSLRVILDICENSIMAYDPLNLAEDWAFYRREVLFFGVVSHETYAFLRLTPEEYASFRELNLPHRIENPRH